MHRLRSMWRTFRLLAAAAFCWAAVHGPALVQAAAPKKDEEGGGGSGTGSWLVSYSLVILGVALGLLCVCQSSRRRDRAKPEVFGEGQSSVKPE